MSGHGIDFKLTVKMSSRKSEKCEICQKAKKRRRRSANTSTHLIEAKKTYFHRTAARKKKARRKFFSISACDLQNKKRRRSRKRKSKFNSYARKKKNKKKLKAVKYFYVGCGFEERRILIHFEPDVGKTFIDPNSIHSFLLLPPSPPNSNSVLLFCILNCIHCSSSSSFSPLSVPIKTSKSIFSCFSSSRNHRRGIFSSLHPPLLSFFLQKIA